MTDLKANKNIDISKSEYERYKRILLGFNQENKNVNIQKKSLGMINVWENKRENFEKPKAMNLPRKYKEEVFEGN